MAIITYPLNGITYNAENAESYLCTRQSGVFSAENQFAVTVTGDREITISPGLAWINNAQFSGKSVLVDSAVALAVPTADGALPRVDRVVLRFDKANNETTLVVKPGTASSSPAAPQIERTDFVYELGLYTIAVPAASLTVSAADIASTLLDESVCGLMRDGVTGLPSAQVQAQWTGMLARLSDALATAQGDTLLTYHVHTVALPASGWEGSGPYTQTVAVSGVLSTDDPIADVDMSAATVETAADIQAAWTQVDRIDTADGAVTAVCFAAKPAVDLSVRIMGVR